MCPKLASSTVLFNRSWFKGTVFRAELGTRQFFSFATTTTRQRNIASKTSQEPGKNRKIVSPQCLDGVATITIVKWQLQTTGGENQWPGGAYV